MQHQILISFALIAGTTLLHGIFIAFAANAVRPFTRMFPRPVSFLRNLLALVVLSLWLMLAHFIEIAMWGFAYYELGVLPDFETSFYFASVCYTTLGFGGIEMAQYWRLLPGANAANGFLLFGMTAAFLLDLNNKLRLNR